MAQRIFESKEESLGETLQLFILESTYENMMKGMLSPERFEKCLKNRLLYPKDWDLFSDVEKKKELLIKAINTGKDIKDIYYSDEDESAKTFIL